MSWRASRNPPISGAIIGLRILKTKTFPDVKFCSKFALSCLEIIVKDQSFRISGSQFKKWLFGPETFSGLSRNGPSPVYMYSLHILTQVSVLLIISWHTLTRTDLYRGPHTSSGYPYSTTYDGTT